MSLGTAQSMKLFGGEKPSKVAAQFIVFVQWVTNCSATVSIQANSSSVLLFLHHLHDNLSGSRAEELTDAFVVHVHNALMVDGDHKLTHLGRRETQVKYNQIPCVLK